MNKVNFLASEIQYFDHIIPVWKALPDDVKGTFYVSSGVMFARPEAKANCKIGQSSDGITLVSGWADYKATTGKVIYLEHGIGQQYGNSHPSYPAGRGKDRVILFLNQHHLTQEANSKAYPNAKNTIIGTPKMDVISPETVKHGTGIVCISFHWECAVCPETMNAFNYYRDAIIDLAKSGKFKIALHAHPRNSGAWQDKIKRDTKRYNIPFYDNFVDVMNEADVYVIDNSSTYFEFMLTGKPVIALNIPQYRRDVEHGLRFWSHIGGIQVNHPFELERSIGMALNDPEWFAMRRKEIVEELYPYHTEATQRACKAILDGLKTM